jgi:hypothetical protein
MKASHLLVIWSRSLIRKSITFMYTAKTNFYIVVLYANFAREGRLQLCLPSHSIQLWPIKSNIANINSLNLLVKCNLWSRWSLWWSCNIKSIPDMSTSSCSGWRRGIRHLVVQKLRPKITIHVNGHLSGWTIRALSQMHDLIHHSAKNSIHAYGK